ncbi:MAG: Cfr10I/Bse634I family restriction endonuclease [Pedobacter agri]
MSFNIDKGKITLTKDVAFCEYLNQSLPPADKEIDVLIKEIKLHVQGIAPMPIESSAFSNAAGDWYEWLIALSAWNYCVANPSANLLLLLPNVSTFAVGKLYTSRLYGLIEDLKQKVLDSSGVHLISSNPDFVIIDRALVNECMVLNSIPYFDIPSIKMLENSYLNFVDKCDFEDIIGYLSVKSSLRPDRRLQMAHEGSLMKALYTHIQTREWVLDPKGIKYYAMSTKIGGADRIALKTVATHSITTVHDKPQAAVDESFEVNSLQAAMAAFQDFLH